MLAKRGGGFGMVLLKEAVMPSSQSKDIETQVESIRESRVTKPLRIALIAAGLGIAVEVLFFGHPWGVNFLLWALLVGSALVIASVVEGVEPARYELLLLIPILVLAFLTFMRLEPFTVFLCVVLTLFGFTIWVRTFRSDRLLNFGWIDALVALIWVPIEAWLRPWSTLVAAWRDLVGSRGMKSRSLAVTRGVLLALPILVIFIALLAAADMVFGGFVEKALAWLDLDVIFEYTGRLFVMLVSALFFLGAIVAALLDPGERKLVGEEKPILAPFLGFIESAVILGAVDLLFISFVIVQFAYLFGGAANITAAGYTYSEYARQGFGELVLVAILSLGMIMALGYWGKREVKKQAGWFNALSTLLVLLLGVMLTSAMMRLVLYEQAYGFTRFRTYTHVFIIWLAILLVVFVVLLYCNGLRKFVLVCALGAIGFTVSLAVLNVDDFIVEQNTRRFFETGDIDIYYLTGLSNDAVPGLIELGKVGDREVREVLLPQLACTRYRLEGRREDVSWPSFHLSRQRAYQLLEAMDLLDSYEVYGGDYALVADGPNGETYCSPRW